MPPVMQTAREKILATIQEMHALGWNDRAIAGEIGLHYSTVQMHRSQTLGLAPNYSVTPGVVRGDNKVHPHRERIIELLAEGWSDGYIARLLGLNRRELSNYRRKHLKIEARPREEQLDRDSGRRGQDRSLGRSLGEHRATVYWSIGPDLGWPEGLRFRAVQMLELLLRHPDGLTRQQIRQQLDLTEGQMKGNDPQGTYLANLIARELVTAAARCIPTGRLVTRRNGTHPTGAGQNVHLYFATPLAFETKARWRECTTVETETQRLTELARLGRDNSGHKPRAISHQPLPPTE